MSGDFNKPGKGHKKRSSLILDQSSTNKADEIEAKSSTADETESVHSNQSSEHAIGPKDPTPKDWRGTFPGPADRSFNYRKLLDKSKNGIGKAQGSRLRVAIIGAGPAGLTAAHELVRSGLETVHLYEASDRYGGRFWTKTVEDDHSQTQFTAMDAGAMRMPPFIQESKKQKGLKGKERQLEVWSGSSVLSYYLNKYNITTDEFPNPGSEFATTGIYYNKGSLEPDAEVKQENKNAGISLGTDDLYADRTNSKDAKGKMLIWPADQKIPPNSKLKEVQRKWREFGKNLTDLVKARYETDEWPTTWKNIVRAYYKKTFRDVVFDKPIKDKKANSEGNFGGMGMTEEEARIFYVIGAGDGGWGSFFNLSFLYVYRTFVHGFGTDLQVIEGLFDIDTKERRDGAKQGAVCRDTLGSQIRTPEYLGTSAITDCMLFEPVETDGKGKAKKGGTSLYDNQNREIVPERGFRMFFSSPVSKIEKTEKGTIKLSVNTPGSNNYANALFDGLETYDFNKLEYDAVIITVPTHQFGTDINVTGFSDKEWPYDLQAYLSQAHWEPCSKVFVELTEPYWEKLDCNIPQIIESETAVRDTYGVKVNRGTAQNGVLLLSYTWWRDATKLVGYEDQDLINMIVKQADMMLANCKNMSDKDRFSNYIKFTKDKFGNKNYKGWVHHWELQTHYKGAARLYDQRTWNNTQVPMMYNQLCSKESGLYFAGEGYHVDAGWVEPAFRTAIDSVLRIFYNNNIKIATEDFDYDRDFKLYDPDFNPLKEDLESEDKNEEDDNVNDDNIVSKSASKHSV